MSISTKTLACEAQDVSHITNFAHVTDFPVFLIYLSFCLHMRVRICSFKAWIHFLFRETYPILSKKCINNLAHDNKVRLQHSRDEEKTNGKKCTLITWCSNTSRRQPTRHKFVLKIATRCFLNFKTLEDEKRLRKLVIKSYGPILQKSFRPHYFRMNFSFFKNLWNNLRCCDFLLLRQSMHQSTKKKKSHCTPFTSLNFVRTKLLNKRLQIQYLHLTEKRNLYQPSHICAMIKSIMTVRYLIRK